MMNRSARRVRSLARIVLGLCLGASLLAQGPGERRPAEQSDTSGQAATVLSDGRILLTGGVGPRGAVDTAAVREPLSGSTTTLRAKLGTGRAWHSATVLPDGRVLLFGGVDAKGAVLAAPEIFDPERSAFSRFQTEVAPRAGHSATLLSDGRVLVVGGRSSEGHLTPRSEIWDPASGAVLEVSGAAPRTGHAATVLGDGAVLLEGGTGEHGQPVAPELVFPEQPAVQLHAGRARAGRAGGRDESPRDRPPDDVQRLWVCADRHPGLWGAEAQTTTYVRASPSHRVTSATDALGRETTSTYDGLGNLTSVTRLAGTAGAVTTSVTYEPLFQQLKTVTDPLNHTMTFGHDSRGSVVAVTDPLTHQTTLAYNGAGQPVAVTDALHQTTTFGYHVTWWR